MCVCVCVSYRKLAKSTFVLLLVFGIHYIIFVGLPHTVEGLSWEVRMYCELFFNSFQVTQVVCPIFQLKANRSSVLSLVQLITFEIHIEQIHTSISTVSGIYFCW